MAQGLGLNSEMMAKGGDILKGNAPGTTAAPPPLSLRDLVAGGAQIPGGSASSSSGSKSPTSGKPKQPK